MLPRCLLLTVRPWYTLGMKGGGFSAPFPFSSDAKPVVGRTYSRSIWTSGKDGRPLLWGVAVTPSKDINGCSNSCLNEAYAPRAARGVASAITGAKTLFQATETSPTPKLLASVAKLMALMYVKSANSVTSPSLGLGTLSGNYYVSKAPSKGHSTQSNMVQSLTLPPW